VCVLASVIQGSAVGQAAYLFTAADLPPRVEEWEGLRGVGSEQEKRRKQGKGRRDRRRGKEKSFSDV